MTTRLRLPSARCALRPTWAPSARASRWAGLAWIVLLAACTSPRHLQYDYGRAYTAAIAGQADLTRPAVQDIQHPLAGVEAQAIRLRVAESTTDAESGDSQLTTGGGQ